MLLRSGRPCGRELAFMEERLLPADGADEDRRFPFRLEDVNAQICFRDVHKPPRLQTDVLEGFHVCLQCQVIVDTGGHVAPVCGRQRAPGRFLEVHHLQEIFRGSRNRIVRRDELLRPCARGWGHDGAGRNEQEELAAIL
jgi:hypothetical protein